MESSKCPECGGPAEIVYKNHKAVFIKCKHGHYRSYRYYNRTYYEKFHPVYMLDYNEANI